LGCSFAAASVLSKQNTPPIFIEFATLINQQADGFLTTKKVDVLLPICKMNSPTGNCPKVDLPLLIVASIFEAVSPHFYAPHLFFGIGEGAT